MLSWVSNFSYLVTKIIIFYRLGQLPTLPFGTVASEPAPNLKVTLYTHAERGTGTGKNRYGYGYRYRHRCTGMGRVRKSKFAWAHSPTHKANDNSIVKAIRSAIAAKRRCSVYKLWQEYKWKSVHLTSLYPTASMSKNDHLTVLRHYVCT